MYHTNKINQVNKSSSNKSFLSKDSLTVNYNGAYFAACTPFEQDILTYIPRFMDHDSTCIKHGTIALAVGCSHKTVARAMNKFFKDGIITKYQQNRYAPNHYSFNDSIKKAFFHNINTLSHDQYISHRTIVDHKNKKICSDVQHYKNSLILNNLYIYKYPLTRMRERGKRYKNSKGYLTKSETHKKGVELVNEFQKKWILDHRTDPRVKDMLNEPRIKAALITPTIEKITQSLTLDEREQLKLIAFNEDALKYALACIDPIVLGKKSIKGEINDRMGWLISILNGYCKKHGLAPEWSWYYDICEIINIEPTTVGDDRKPLHIQKPKRYTGGHSPAVPKPVLSFEEQIMAAQLSVAGFEKQLENPEQFWDPRSTLFSMNISVAKTLLARAQRDLEELEAKKSREPLRSSNEKQTVLYKNNPYSMAACNA